MGEVEDERPAFTCENSLIKQKSWCDIGGDFEFPSSNKSRGVKLEVNLNFPYK
jgi:hypothetical protein